MIARRRVAALALAIAVIAFGAGAFFGMGTAKPRILVGSGYVGGEVATFQAADTSYGFRSSVSWTDEAGSFHDGGWPECLGHLRSVSDVRFAGEFVRVGEVAFAQVVWVDCRS